MSKLQFNSVIHAPNRLQICAFLMPLEEAEFKVLRETLAVSESVFSKHIAQLVEAGYVKVRKSVVDGRQRKWARLTGSGRKAFAEHVSVLTDLAASAESGPKS